MKIPKDLEKEATGELATFDDYRREIDKINGMMRTGIYSRDTYECAILDKNTLLINGMPLAITNGLLHEFNFDVVPSDALIATSFIDGQTYSDLLVQRQTMLSHEMVDSIMNNPQALNQKSFLDELTSNNYKLVAENGLPEFLIFSAYDTSQRPDMMKEPSKELTTQEGHLVTANRAKIKKLIPELVKLHKDVFENQALQIGYYGGLDEESITEIIYNPEFIPIVVIEKDTNNPLMFALFSPNFTDIEQFEWINPEAVTKMIEFYSQDKKRTYSLTLPLVITSKFSGLGLFKYAVQLGAHDSIYKTKADTSFLMYESNALSIMFTPKIINNNMKKLGIPLIGASIEATYLTRQTK